MLKVVLIFAICYLVIFQINNSIFVVIPTIYQDISWNLMPKFTLSTPFLNVFKMCATFYVSLVIWVLPVNTMLFATVISQIISLYALLCGLDFIKRLNEKVVHSSDSATKVLMAYKSLTILTIHYNSIHRIWLMCSTLLLSGVTLTVSAYLVIIHNQNMGLVITMMFGCFA